MQPGDRDRPIDWLQLASFFGGPDLDLELTHYNETS
jgi:hypothetical protein